MDKFGRFQALRSFKVPIWDSQFSGTSQVKKDVLAETLLFDSLIAFLVPSFLEFFASMFSFWWHLMITRSAGMVVTVLRKARSSFVIFFLCDTCLFVKVQVLVPSPTDKKKEVWARYYKAFPASRGCQVVKSSDGTGGR